jgi:hypothetical protein
MTSSVTYIITLRTNLKLKKYYVKQSGHYVNHHFSSQKSYLSLKHDNYQLHIYYYLQTYTLQPSRLIVRSGLDVSTLATRRLHACHHVRAPSGGKWNCGREMSGNFSLTSVYTLHLGIFYMP